MKCRTYLTLTLLLSLPAGCLVGIEGHVAGALGTAVGQQVAQALPPPSAAVQGVDAVAVWCQLTASLGWPAAISAADVGPTAQRPVLAVIEFGQDNCGW